MLVVGEDGIRRDVAEVLHGRVQSRLLALELKLGRLAATLPELEGASIDEITEHLRTLREEDVRSLSHSLHPSVIRLGLLPALNDLAEHAEGGLGLSVFLDADRLIEQLDTPGSNGLSEAARLTLYRAAEEGIVNAHRHGRAQRVTIELRPAPDAVLLLVHDDGRGASRDTTAGFGLTSIALRAKAHGGSMSLDHNPGGGMTLQVRLPVALDDHADVGKVPAVAARRVVPSPVSAVRSAVPTKYGQPWHRRLSLS
jgi:signal transduction histidine kinase